MNKFDINKNKLEIGDVVVLSDCFEARTRDFEFWEVYADGTTSLVYIKGLTSGKTDSFDCKCLKKVDKKYKELVDKAIPKKAIKDEIQDIRYITKYTCPMCGGKITGRVSDYCYHCGQALDWSDEE